MFPPLFLFRSVPIKGEQDLALTAQQLLCQFFVPPCDQCHMQPSLIFISGQEQGLLRRGEDCDRGSLLALLIFFRRCGVIYIKSLGVCDGQDFDKTQLWDIRDRLQLIIVIVMVQADDIPSLELVGSR